MPCLAYKGSRLPRNHRKVPSSRNNLFRSEERGCNPDVSYSTVQVLYTREALAVKGRNSSKSLPYTQGLKALAEARVDISWLEARPLGEHLPQFVRCSQSVPERPGQSSLYVE